MPTNKALSLSIVIPVYNEEDHLKDCLDSIAMQTVSPLEVIVVDNNSTDGTVVLAQKYEFVRVVIAEKQGIVHARNAGFNAVQGDIIGRIDADSRLHPDWVATCSKYFEESHDISAITGHCYFYDFPFKKFVQVIHHAFYYGLQRIISGTEILWGSNMAITSKAWQAVAADCQTGPRMHEDIDLSIQLQDKGYKIRRIPKLMAGVSLRRGDISTRSLSKYLWPWPRTYWINGRYFQASVITLVLAIVMLLTLPISLIATFLNRFRA